MSLRGGTTKQSRRVQYASDEIAALSLAITNPLKQKQSLLKDSVFVFFMNMGDSFTY
ncbi:hypothetical protein SAMN05216490_2192 [Mucilaginibacter mallensis]|uniref:Uncharacterized protein n=1 Tax=Mucilaginibacter mallensis TaxID=652787 RepID=A0A1H1WHL4_MUCMA|nr:hypothetical protein SAMN05216490_2192 [Mucilaginibacter mallensis]